MPSTSDPQIVTATPEMPATPEGMIKAPQKLFEIEPPGMDELRRKFSEARDMTSESRKKQQKDRKYFDGPEQLSSDVRATLKARNQPAIYSNRIRPAINGILGVLDGSKVDPRCYPRNPDDQNASDVATKTLRFVADKNRFDEVKLDCAENYWIEGDCAVIIEGTQDDVPISQIRWEEFFYDPRARRHDLKDAAYMGFAKWMYCDAVQRYYPEAYAQIGDPVDGGRLGTTETWEDKPEDAPTTQWVDRKSRRILVVTLFYERGGEWYRCVYCAAGVFDHGLTGYLEKGRNINPIEAVRCYVDTDNKSYGQVRDMIPIQDEINARRSRLLHLANSRQIQQTDANSPPVDEGIARLEAAKADGIIPPGWQLVPTADLASGQQLLLAESKAEIERMGPTPAVLGRQGETGQSGRARLVLQQAGMTELARPMGRLNDWETRVYRQMWLRAQQFWTAPMFIRVTDDVRAPEFIQINEPVQGMVVQPQPMADPLTGQPVVDPNTGEPAMQMIPAIGVVDVKNRIADLDMDIIVSTQPDTANLQMEVWAELTDLAARAGGLQAVFTQEFELMIEASPLADKQRVIEMLRRAREEREKDQIVQMQQTIAQLQAALEEKQQTDQAETFSNVRKNLAAAGKSDADAMKTTVEAQRLAIEPILQPMMQ